MHDWQSLSHVRWDCKYHVVIVPKYRKRKLYGKFKRHVSDIIKDLCRQRGVVAKEKLAWPNPPPGFLANKDLAAILGVLCGSITFCSK